MKAALSGGELSAGESVEVLVSAAHGCGITGAELWYPRNFDRVRPAATVEQFRREGIEIVCIAIPAEMVRENSIAADQALLLDAIRRCAESGIPCVNSYFGYVSRRDDAAAVDAYARSVDACLREAEHLGVSLYLENECDYFGHDPAGSDLTRRGEATVALCRRLASSHFGITFDPANALFAGNDPIAFYRAVRQFVGHVHVKDGRLLPAADGPAEGYHGLKDEDRRYTTCPLGQGEVLWPQLIAELLQDGYAGYLTLEPHCLPAIRNVAWKEAAAYTRSLLQTAPNR